MESISMLYRVHVYDGRRHVLMTTTSLKKKLQIFNHSFTTSPNILLHMVLNKTISISRHPGEIASVERLMFDD